MAVLDRNQILLCCIIRTYNCIQYPRSQVLSCDPTFVGQVLSCDSTFVGQVLSCDPTFVGQVFSCDPTFVGQVLSCDPTFVGVQERASEQGYTVEALYRPASINGGARTHLHHISVLTHHQHTLLCRIIKTQDCTQRQLLYSRSFALKKAASFIFPY